MGYWLIWKDISSSPSVLFMAYWIQSRLVWIMKWFSKSNLKSVKIRWVRCLWRSALVIHGTAGDAVAETVRVPPFLALLRASPLLSMPPQHPAPWGSGLVHPAQAVESPSWLLLSALKSCSNILALFSYPRVAYMGFFYVPTMQFSSKWPMALSSHCGPSASAWLAHSRHSWVFEEEEARVEVRSIIRLESGKAGICTYTVWLHYPIVFCAPCLIMVNDIEIVALNKISHESLHQE